MAAEALSLSRFRLFCWRTRAFSALVGGGEGFLAAEASSEATGSMAEEDKTPLEEVKAVVEAVVAPKSNFSSPGFF